MTKFDVLKGITGVKEFSRLIFGMAEKAGTPEKLEKELSRELFEEELQTIRSVAQNGIYPLSLDGIQK